MTAATKTKKVAAATKTKKVAAPKATRTPVSKATLQKAAKMRDGGATWNEIREATGTKLNSTLFFRHWDKEGIAFRPANTLKAKVAKKATAPKAKKVAAKVAPKVRTKATAKAA